MMRKHNHIKAFFFLGVFSLLLLHQVLPHWHHNVEVVHTHKVEGHHVEDHHHHHDVNENSKSKGILDLLLETHEHSLVSCEVLLVQKSSVKHLKVKKVVNTLTLVNHYNISINYDDKPKKRIVYHPPNTYFNSYLSTLDTRGPPSLS